MKPCQRALDVMKQTADAIANDGQIDMTEAFEIINAVALAAGFSTTNIVGEAGEAYANKYYKGEIQPNSCKHYDILVNNKRIQVKTRGTHSKPNIDGIQYKDVFDMIAVVTYDKEKGFTGIIEISHDEYFANARYRDDKAKPCWSWTLTNEVLKRDRIYV